MEVPVAQKTIFMPHVDREYYMDHLDKCGVPKQVDPYTVGKLSFL